MKMLIRLCRIGPICWPIWYDYSRNKINLIFNASNGWQFTRHLFWKYISIFLQKSNSRTRQIRINVRNIQVGLLAYKYKDRSTCIKCNPHISFFCIQTHFSLILFLITLLLPRTLSFFNSPYFIFFALFFHYSIFFILSLFGLSLDFLFYELIYSQLVFIHLHRNQRCQGEFSTIHVKRVPILISIMHYLSIKLPRPTK